MCGQDVRGNARQQGAITAASRPVAHAATTKIHDIAAMSPRPPAMTRDFAQRSTLAVSAADCYDWHLRDGAFERLSPPWQKVTLDDAGQGVAEGSVRVVATRIGPLRSRWVMRHTDIEPGRQFVDVMQRGPFPYWRHTHRFEPAPGMDSSTLEDRIEYALPLGVLGDFFGGRMARRQLERLFRYRHRITGDDLAAHRRWKEVGAMKVLLTGASGMIGSILSPFLTAGGHCVVGLRRAGRDVTGPTWDSRTGVIDGSALAGADAIVHLAGENIGAGRWTAERKRRIRDSRVGPTRALCEQLAKMPNPPRTLVVASAVGLYGDRGEEWLTESSAPGEGFLAGVVREWEAATAPATARGIRVVNLRFGIILTPRGGALQRMLLPFKLGLGGVMGSGRQYWSWVDIDDVIGAIHHALMNQSLSGPVNVVSPNPVTNREFTRTLARVLSRPAIFPLPAPVARVALGEMADELLLYSARVRPEKLQASSYHFRHTDLEEALRHQLGR